MLTYSMSISTVRLLSRFKQGYSCGLPDTGIRERLFARDCGSLPFNQPVMQFRRVTNSLSRGSNRGAKSASRELALG
jgi:hypothetical protein